MKHFTNTIECLGNGAPHTKEAAAFDAFFKKMGNNPNLHFVRVFITFDLSHKTEKLQDNIYFMMSQYQELLSDEVRLAMSLARSLGQYQKKLHIDTANPEADDRLYTQAHYGTLFKNLNAYAHYDEAYALLNTRLTRNNIKLETKGKIALDVGCGGGRYTLALKKLGFEKVYGVDYSSMNIDTAGLRAKKIRNVFFKKADAHALPFKNNMFDFVFCNGVLHHSHSIRDGVKEIVRVMKPNGYGWLYLINKPGGIHWDTVELLRRVMRPVQPEYARNTLRLLGVPENRIFFILDHIMVPINILSSSNEIERMIKENNITDFKRLERGADTDMIEKLWKLKKTGNDDKEMIWKYGSGEHRYYFRKS
ncbi:MAG: methyltransferase [Parcubacteria group bacterium Gr01-1014_48]|nr:MAG: methyltransferase [Parcubacteria group bacterium Greene0416_14]TSC74455.1 MAG: methyltransferase [Parcubacteria group bacterium Gr01-1014_48]TSD01765.1 MAG: methyltransferase [Parcubacteria group bacterium Greene1014_15]TSD08479.1 MAG: methyltransferase [Parcubacteria group bacterium Greene0714_4]